MFFQWENREDLGLRRRGVSDGALKCVANFKYYLEIFNIEASKGNAVKALCEYYGFSKDEVITIGDNFNDLSMLVYSGISVAMGNSPDEIKKMCTFVTKTNEESGVAHAIYSLIK